MQLFNALIEFHQGAQFLAQHDRGISHASSVLAEEHLGLESDYLAKGIKQCVDIFIGAQVLESRGEIKITAEEPLAVRLPEHDVVLCVSGRVDHLELKPSRLELVPYSLCMRRSWHAPSSAAIQLRVQVWLGDASDTARMCQRGNMKVLTQQAVTACMVFMVVGGDALANS